MFRKSFKFKLLASYFLLIVIPFSFVALFLDSRLEETALNDIKVSLAKQSALIQDQIKPLLVEPPGSDRLTALIKTLSSQIGARLTVIDPRGKVLADSEKTAAETLAMENHAARPEIIAALAGSMGEAIRYSSTLKINMLYIARALPENGVTRGILRIALPLEQVRRIQSTTRKTVLFGFLLALGLAFVTGSILSKSLIRPVSKIMYVSRKFSRGDFSHRIYLNNTDEIGELAATINAMGEDIQAKINEVQVQNQKLRTIFQGMVEGIMLVDKTGTVISVNPAIERIFSIGRPQIEGKLLLESVRNADIAALCSRVFEAGSLVSQELTIVWPVQRILQINASPIFEQQTATACLLVIHDVTEMRRLELVRSDFVANVSHELKTPLTSIKGFVETLREGALEDKENARHFLEIIEEHADRLNKLINDLLDLSYLESKEAALRKEPVRLKVLADKVLSGFSQALKKRSINTVNELSGGLSAVADADKIEQVLTNYLDNAIKFNREKGSIRIFAQQSDTHCKIIVEDSGIGIPPKDIPRIFERFYRVDKARSRELGGTGLGLSIVKHIIELHGGTVGVESTEGHGSSFWFTLPL